jgi:CheY-like chemotaxis protein
MAGLRVLVVEDDPDVQLLFSETLQWAGHSVQVADNGQHALDLLTNEFSPQLILLDMSMPVMDGFTFLGRKRTIPELTDIPVIVISATAEPPIDGAYCVLRKPLDPTDLIATIKQHFATPKS